MTGGAQAPENDFGFVDDKAVMIQRFQARRHAGAIRVHDQLALTADEMMVIVVYSGFIEGRAALRLDLPDQTALYKSREVVIDRLLGCR